MQNFAFRIIILLLFRENFCIVIMHYCDRTMFRKPRFYFLCEKTDYVFRFLFFTTPFLRFGERMSDVKKENEKRTTQFIDRTSNGLVGNKIVSRKTILANKSSNFSSDRGNEFHRYSQTHGHGSRPHGGLLAGSHPMLDRNADKHKRRGGQQPSEIMKRSLR